jgi:hypothetical protein
MGFWFAVVAAYLLTLWACVALRLDLPFPSWRATAATAYLVTVSTILVLFKANWLAMLAPLGAFLGVLIATGDRT